MKHLALVFAFFFRALSLAWASVVRPTAHAHTLFLLFLRSRLGVLCAVLFLGLLAAPNATPSAHAAHPTTWRDLPFAAQAMISNARGHDDAAFAATVSPRGFRIENAPQNLSVEFDPTGMRLNSGDASFGLGLQAYGFADAMNAVTAVAPRANANRVEYPRGELTEWYLNGPLGVEQGFTILRAPAGDRQTTLTLAFALSGNVDAHVDESGAGLVLLRGNAPTSLRYAGLSAVDATGRELRAWLELGDHKGAPLQIRVDDTGAQYPLTIDPYILQATLTNSGGAANDYLGESVAISADGSTIVAGALGVST